MDYSEWAKFIVAIVGMAIGYGMLRQSVKDLKEDLNDHKMGTNDRFLRIEGEVDEINKVLSKLETSVVSIDKRTDRMDLKLDKILEK